MIHCFSVSSLSQWMKGGIEITVSNHGLIFLVTSHHPEAIQVPSKMHFNRTSDTTIIHKRQRDLGALCQEPGSKKKNQNKICSQHPDESGHYKSFRSSLTRTRIQEQILKQRCSKHFYHQGNYKDFRSFVSGNSSKSQIYISCYISSHKLLIAK